MGLGSRALGDDIDGLFVFGDEDTDAGVSGFDGTLDIREGLCA